jgi:hypothetical protein
MGSLHFFFFSVSLCICASPMMEGAENPAKIFANPRKNHLNMSSNRILYLSPMNSLDLGRGDTKSKQHPVMLFILLQSQSLEKTYANPENLMGGFTPSVHYTLPVPSSKKYTLCVLVSICQSMSYLRDDLNRWCSYESP